MCKSELCVCVCVCIRVKGGRERVYESAFFVCVCANREYLCMEL